MYAELRSSVQGGVTAIIQSRGSRFMSIVFRRRALLDNAAN